MFSVAHLGMRHRKHRFLWRTAQGAPQKYFSGALPGSAPQKQKYMRHRIIYRYSEIAAACCINTGILQEIQVYIQDLYRYNRNNNIFDTVYENRHITMSSHYLEPEIHKYSDKCRIFTQVMIQKFIDHVTRYK